MGCFSRKCMIIISLMILAIAITIRYSRSFIYDLLISDMTTIWYASFLKSVPAGSFILDVGVGTCTALIRNKEIILHKHLSIEGIDIDGDYINTCKTNIKKENLQYVIKVKKTSVYEYRGMPYDVGYFSGSLMTMNNKILALKNVMSLLTKSKRPKIYLTQTFENKPQKWLEYFKPLIKFFTTIDFGTVTYTHNFKDIVYNAGMRITLNQTIEIDNQQTNSFKSPTSEFHLIRIEPRKGFKKKFKFEEVTPNI